MDSMRKLEEIMRTLQVSQNHNCNLYMEHKKGAENCDIIFGFSIKPSHSYTFDMEIDESTSCVKETKPRLLVHAHKEILRQASPIFEKILENQWANTTNPIEIPELTAAQFITFLEILYVGKVEEVNTTEESFTLYCYAVKYRCEIAIRLLSSSIVENMFQKRDIKGFFSVFESLSMYPNTMLEETCLDFISNFTQKIIESDTFLHANPKTIEIIYKQDIMNIENELNLLKAMEKYVMTHENAGRSDILSELKHAIGSIRFQILEEQQILDTFLLSDVEKQIFIGILKEETTTNALPLHFTQKIHTRYDAQFVKYSSLDIFKLMTNFYRCGSDACSKEICPSFFADDSDLPDLKPEHMLEYHDTMQTLENLHQQYLSGSEKVVEEMMHHLHDLQFCFKENGDESNSSSNSDVVLSSDSEEI